MEKSIYSFPDHILDALRINNILSSNNASFSSVIIAGQGGSAIGGFLISDLLNLKKNNIPVLVNQGYELPYWAGDKTLLIVSSYSGNTEETINVLNQGIQNKCHIVCLSSGGRILDLAKENNLEYALLPKGFQPRAAIGYSIVQLFQILDYKKILTSSSNLSQDSFIKAASFLKDNQYEIIQRAQCLAEKIKEKITVVYCSFNFFATALRLKQQLNENSKSHCWFNIIPEMNHNEIVGWSKKYDNILPLFINSYFDTKENQKRISLTVEHIQQYSYVESISPEGENVFFQIFYLIHFFDFTSLFLANKTGVDASKIEAIDKLKLGLKNNL
tara:strand:- start:300 stop:1289 length:990 start_codon:yes stop_codon:yes gene_type:complete